MNFQNFTTFRTILIALVLTITSNQLFAQNTNGIFFQAVARDNFSNPAKDRKIYVQSSIIQTTPTGIKVLTEEHQTNTDASGVFSINVGNGARVGGTATSLANIDWSKGPFYLNLKLAITPIGGNSNWDYTKEWVDIGTTNFGAVPYALYSASSAKVDDKLNITDTSKMLAIYAKALTVQSLAKDVDNKLSSKDTLAMLAPYAKAAFVLDSAYINTQLKSKVTLADSTLIYVTPTMLKSKTFDTTSLSNRIALKANASDVASDLALKLNKADTILLFQKADTSTLSNRIDLKFNITDTSYLFQKADTSTLSNRIDQKFNISDTSLLFQKADTSTLSNRIDLKFNISDTSLLFQKADTSYLLQKADTSTLSNRIDLKLNKLGESVAIGNNAGISNQDINAVAIGTNAGQNAQSSYSVALGWNAGQTSQATGAVAIGSPAGQTNQGINSVAIGNGAGQTNQGSQSVAIGLNAGQTNQGVNAISIGAYSQASFSNSTALGYQAVTTASNTIQLGADGTGGTTAITNVKTSGTLTAGTVTYPNAHNSSSGQVLITDVNGVASFGSIPILNQNTTGSAATLTTARNINGVAFDGSADITVTANAGTLTGTTLASNVVNSSLTSVGTIATGVWSGTAVAIANGGTGTTNGSITGTSALTFAAGGNNQNISIKPSGTGSVIVGTGTITPTSSAALDVNSTSQGFLPPRLTTTQRDAITGPVEGLTIWNKTNKQLEVYDGSYWVNMIGKLVSTLNIGDSYGGGKVAYIFTSSDPGYIAGQTHGLIAATSDQTTDVGVKWFPYTFYGATGTYLGLGLPNTVTIIASAVLQGSTDITTFAAGLASSYRGGGYIDWYLPSKDELNKLYNNRVAIGGFATSGSIATYWSSTQKGSLSYSDFNSFKTGVASAYQQFFFTYNGNSEGTQNDLGISNLRRVRAVRTF